jgi:hypothetical protein
MLEKGENKEVQHKFGIQMKRPELILSYVSETEELKVMVYGAVSSY